MAIIIRCPNCRQKHQLSESKLGKPLACRKCGNTFTVTSTADQAVPAQPEMTLLDSDDFPLMLQEATTLPIPSAKEANPFEFSTAPLLPALYHRKRKTGRAAIVLSALALAGLVALGLLWRNGYFSSVAKVAPQLSNLLPFAEPSASEVEAWSHKELLAYLDDSKGLKLNSFFGETKGEFDSPTIWVATGKPRYVIQAYKSFIPMNSWDVVCIAKLPTAQAAKDRAGVLGDSACSLGPFLFCGDFELIAAIEKALGRRPAKPRRLKTTEPYKDPLTEEIERLANEKPFVPTTKPQKP
jgi:hypothetical protein